MTWHDWLIITFLMLIAPKIWDAIEARLADRAERRPA